MWSKRCLNLLALLCVACLVSACGAVQTDLTFYNNKQYQAVTSIALSAQALSSQGGAVALERELDAKVTQAQAAGARAKWHRSESARNGEAVYILEISGQGYGPPLSDYVDVQPVEFGGQPALKIAVVPGVPLIKLVSGTLDSNALTYRGGQILATLRTKLGELTSGSLDTNTLTAQGSQTLDTLQGQLNELINGVQGESPLTIAFTIHGGEILETNNGKQIGKDAATLDLIDLLKSGGRSYVVLRPRTIFPWLYVGVGAGVFALLGVIAFLVFRPRPKKGPAGRIYCPYCGAALARGTRICVRCRRSLPLR
jgi:hypothetical protein